MILVKDTLIKFIHLKQRQLSPWLQETALRTETHDQALSILDNAAPTPFQTLRFRNNFYYKNRGVKHTA